MHSQVLTRDPNSRLTLREVRDHNWITKNKSSEKKLLPMFDTMKDYEDEINIKYKEAIKQFNERYMKNSGKPPISGTATNNIQRALPKIMKVGTMQQQLPTASVVPSAPRVLPKFMKLGVPNLTTKFISKQ